MTHLRHLQDQYHPNCQRDIRATIAILAFCLLRSAVVSEEADATTAMRNTWIGPRWLRDRGSKPVTSTSSSSSSSWRSSWAMWRKPRMGCRPWRTSPYLRNLIQGLLNSPSEVEQLLGEKAAPVQPPNAAGAFVRTRGPQPALLPPGSRDLWISVLRISSSWRMPAMRFSSAHS